jgi:hypothetical protein
MTKTEADTLTFYRFTVGEFRELDEHGYFGRGKVELLEGYVVTRGIPVYWLVNLPQRQLEVYTRPRGGQAPGFRSRQDFTAGDSAVLAIGTALVGPVAVADLLPPW